MGVTSLWKLLEGCGRTVQLESLANRRLAIDLSIWLHSFIKAMRDREGGMIDNAHLRGLFSRVCKLLFFGVRPVFVFDGATPTLKKATTARRGRVRQEAEHRSQLLAERILLNQLQQEHLAQLSRAGLPAIPQTTTVTTMTSSTIADSVSSADEGDAEIGLQSVVDTEEDAQAFDREFGAAKPTGGSAATAVNAASLARSLQQKILLKHQMEVGDIAIDSPDFIALPEEVKLEVLNYLKQIGADQTRWLMRDLSQAPSTGFLAVAGLRKFKQLPSQTPSSFSQVQVQQFLNRGKIGTHMRSLRRELEAGPRAIASSETATYVFTQDQQASKYMFGRDDTKSKEAVQIVRSAKERRILDPETAKEFEQLYPWIKEGEDAVEDEDDEVSSQEDDVVEIEPSEAQRTTLPPAKRRKTEADAGGSQAIDIDMIGDKDEYFAAEFESDDDSDTPQVPAHRPAAIRRPVPVGVIAIDSDDMAVELEIDHSQKEGEASLEHQLVTELFVKATSAPTTPRTPAAARSVQTRRPVSSAKPSGVIAIESSDDEAVVASPSKQTRVRPPPSPKAISTPKRKVPPPQSNNFVELSDSEDGVDSTGPQTRPKPLSPVASLPAPPPALVVLPTPGNLNNAPSPAPIRQSEPQKQAPAAVSPPRAPSPTAPTPATPPAAPSVRESLPIRTLAPSAAMKPQIAPPTLQNDRQLLDELKETAEIPVDESTLWPAPQVEAMDRELRLEQSALVETRRIESSKAQNVTDSMVLECQELLQLFGVPIVVSPTEADAECAALEMHGLVDGVVSDDNDIFLFGGRHVFRHAFKQDKYMELYDMKEIESELGLSRDELIAVALLVGSDYTEGVKGVGLKTADAITKVFKGPDGMKKFKEWVKTGEETELSVEAIEFYKKYAKLRDRLELEVSFPNPDVVRGYKVPNVEVDELHFQWTCPDLDALRQYAAEKFSWAMSVTDSKLLPVVQRYNKTLDKISADPSQAKITTFFLKSVDNQPIYNTPPLKKTAAKKAGLSSESSKKRKR